MNKYIKFTADDLGKFIKNEQIYLNFHFNRDVSVVIELWNEIEPQYNTSICTIKPIICGDLTDIMSITTPKSDFAELVKYSKTKDDVITM